MYRGFADSHEEYRAFMAALQHTHQRRIWARVLDLSHREIVTINRVLDGQVTIDVTNREVSRVANIRLFDPSRSIGWEPDTPASLPLHLKRMIQIFDERTVPGYGAISCPVFCGPVAEVDREGAEVSVVAEGKDRLAMHSFGRTHHWRKKRKKVEVIREILELAGEASKRIHLPTINATLPKDLNVSRTDRPWIEAKRLARSVDMVLFYDARGHVRMRRQAETPTLGLDKDWLLGPVRIDRPKLEFFNAWVVLGKNPPGDRPRITSGLIGLPHAHPFSAQSLSRNGEPRWMVRQEERPNCSTKAKAVQIARRMRDEKVRSAGDLAVECLPFPNIEEYDLYKVIDPLTGRFQVRVKQATIPLLGGSQSIGALKLVSRGGRGRGFQPAQQGGL